MTTRKPNCYCVIDGTFLPMLTIDVSLGSNGSLSTVNGSSSLTILATSGIDPYEAGQKDDGAAIDVYMGFGNNPIRVFSGVLDDFDFDPGNDKIDFCGRDNAAALADTKQTTSALNYKNQTVGQIVTQIANMFGYTPMVTEPGTLAGPNLWDSSAYMPHGQEYWSMLQELARGCGYECFVTNKNELFFGPSDKAAGTAITVTHAPDPTQGNANNIITNLKMKYQPRRNSNIEVNVISYHPIRGQTVKGIARTIAPTGGAGRKSANAFIGKSGKGIQGAKSGGTKPSAKPIVVKRMDGLTQEDADLRAQAMAKDIAKRQIIISGKVEGIPEAQIHSSLKLKKGKIFLFNFESKDYIISTVDHHYDMETGYSTKLTALTQPEISAN